MLLRGAHLWALLCLALVVQLAVSQSFIIVKRADNAAQTTTSIQPSELPKETNTAGKDGDGNTLKGSGSGSGIREPTGSITNAPSSTQHMTSTLLPTMTTDGPFDNSTLFNATIPAGQLPLSPQLTAGWGVAGVIMLITGVVYTLVGIKNRWIHTFFSTAYMTALGVSVLIVYVMSVPISNALQGGYVVGAIMSGCAVGAAAMFFKELTEGLGCALGGFCVSMWLLCLVPGGLLQSVPSKAIFIASFTIAGFAFYFSRWTRDWALIVMISFGGSTITILGIDCFSRAGLKEFWAYVWDINDNLFPLGADTYPVTKGIRVETAAIIIICLIGIVSQIKLWRIVREKREKRAAERAEDQRNLEHEEENVGRQVEEANSRERRQWEQIYGDETAGSITESRVTDFGDTGSEKRLRSSYITSKHCTSGEDIEMADMSESDISRHVPDALMATEDMADGKITVRVAAEDVPESTTDVGEESFDEKAASRLEANAPKNQRYSKTTIASRRMSQTHTVTEAPEVVPLPFTIPEGDDALFDGDDRSSIATFADDAETAAAEPRKRKSLAKRLSRGSATLLRSFSQRSGRTGGAGGDIISDGGESTEELVLEKSRRPDDDEGSLAATVDDDSISGGNPHSHFGDDEPHHIDEIEEASRRSIEIKAQLGHKDDTMQSFAAMTAKAKSPTASPVPAPVPAFKEEAATEEPTEEMVESPDALPNSDEKTPESRLAPPAKSNTPEALDQAKSIATVSSAPASLTKKRLPRPLSKVAMSYRTNEWAKHLSTAECPEPDELQVATVRAAKKANNSREKPVPVNVEDLRKTAEDGAPAPAIRRSTSQISNGGHAAYAIHHSPKQDMTPATSVMVAQSPASLDFSPEQEATMSPMPPAAAPPRTTSSLRRTPSNFLPIMEEKTVQAEDAPIVAEATLEHQQTAPSSPTTISFDSPLGIATNRAPVPGIVSYASPQTLIGQREQFLRSRSQGSLLLTPPEPTYVIQGQGSDSGSLYNYPMYAAALDVADADDVPLNQRKELIRQGSLMSLTHSQSQSGMSGIRPSSGFESSENVVFNSHQPNRTSTLPTFAAREAQLASFRQSVQHELRSGTPVILSPGRETIFGSSTLLGGGREAEVQRNIEMQRNVLMGQKEAEAQRREMQRREKEYVDRAFDERMRNGDMLGLHREAMRKMQKEAR